MDERIRFELYQSCRNRGVCATCVWVAVVLVVYLDLFVDCFSLMYTYTYIVYVVVLKLIWIKCSCKPINHDNSLFSKERPLLRYIRDTVYILMV